MEETPLPPPDPARVPELLDAAIAAQSRGDEKAASLAAADVLRNASPVQHAVFMRAWSEHPEDMAKVREVMKAANRINAELPREKRMTAAPSANASRAAAATAKSTTVAGNTAAAQGPQAERTTAPSPTPPTRTPRR
uniref:hypothetical protein n=1 Tax=unclassified Streptomyces TaxID=2593676 RepID=UPI003F4910B9